MFRQRRCLLVLLLSFSILSVQSKAFGVLSHQHQHLSSSSSFAAASSRLFRSRASHHRTAAGLVLNKQHITTRTTSSSSSSGSTTELEASPLASTAGLGVSLLLLRGGGGAAAAKNYADPHVGEIIEWTYEWLAELGAPAALVAGAVIATIYENMSTGNLDVLPTDGKWVQIAKKTCRMLLLTAFALETLCIFVTTVTGTMILSRDMDHLAMLRDLTDNSTPLSFLDQNFELEFLTARITFLQGLINWLGAIALGHAIPQTDGTAKDKSNAAKATRYMNKFIAASLLTTMLLMLSFYNGHIDFYQHYGHMLWAWKALVWKQFFWRWPPLPMSFAYIPTGAMSIYWAIRAFWSSDTLIPWSWKSKKGTVDDGASLVNDATAKNDPKTKKRGKA